jgi:deoxyribonuclease-4
MMIRFGPAGIPLSCKGRTLKDGIEDVHNLGLNAMEVQMVRVNMVDRYPDEEEIGLTPMELDSDLVVEIIRDDEALTDLETEIEDEDILITLASGLAQNFAELISLGAMARQIDVQLSMHTPYYMDLASNNELTVKCMDSIRWAGQMTDKMLGNVVVTHMGLYEKEDKGEAKANIMDNIAAIMEWWSEAGLRPKLGLETSGRQEVFGSLDEILEICDNVGGVIPVVNFAHYHAREGGSLNEPEDFGELFDRIRDHVGDSYYTHFAGVEHEGGNERRITPIKKGDLRFEPLSEYLVDSNPRATIISSSPLLEHDAMYMKVIYERILAKTVSKEIRRRKKEEKEKSDE